MTKKKAIIFTGYSKTDSSLMSSVLRSKLERKGYVVTVIDPFKKQRTSWFFRKTLITNNQTKDIVDEIERTLQSAPENFDIAFYYSYGAIAGALMQKVFSANTNVFLSPAVGDKVVQWKPLEKILLLATGIIPNFLPALRDMKDSAFQSKILKKISYMGLASENHFFLPVSPRQKNEDGRVSYSEEIVDTMHELGEVHSLQVSKHTDMIKNSKVTDYILRTVNY